MGTPGMLSVGAGGELQNPLLDSVARYTRLYIPKIDARYFAIIPTGEAFTIRAGDEKWETVRADRFKK